MVTERSGSSNLKAFRKHTAEYFKRFGRSDITLRARSDTKDVMGGVTAQTWAESTITGDFQFVTKREREYVDMGITKFGDGMLFTTNDVSINANDEITIGSIKWKLYQQIEGELVDGGEDYQGWFARRQM